MPSLPWKLQQRLGHLDGARPHYADGPRYRYAEELAAVTRGTGRSPTDARKRRKGPFVLRAECRTQTRFALLFSSFLQFALGGGFLLGNGVCCDGRAFLCR